MKKKLNINVILIGGLLVVALAFFGWQQITKNKGGLATVVFQGSDVKHEIDLSVDDTYTFTEGQFDVTLDVKDGGIRFINSKCPDHVCEGFGYISHEYEYAVCLPAGVSIIIERESK